MKIPGSIILALASSAAVASTPAAWTAMNKRVDRACIAAAGIARPTLLAKKISFSDPIGVEVRMIRGVDRRGRTQRVLCAYNRATGRTEVQEADEWYAAPSRP